MKNKCKCSACADCAVRMKPCCKCKSFVKETLEWFCLVEAWIDNDKIPPANRIMFLKEDIQELKLILTTYRHIIKGDADEAIKRVRALINNTEDAK